MRGARLALGLLLVAGSAAAQGLPPWLAPGRLPLPDEARSAEVLRKDEPLYVAPDSKSARRGAAGLGAHLPIFAAAAGPGCRSDYLLVGPTAWVCGEAVRITDFATGPSPDETRSVRDGLPYDYSFVGPDGSLGYRELATAGQSPPSKEFQPGFAVALRGQGRSEGRNEAFGQTTKGFWLPLVDLGPARPSTFEGYAPSNGALDRGFVVSDSANLYEKPGGPRKKATAPARFETVPVLEVSNAHGRTFVRIAEGSWLDGDDVRVPAPSAPPADARPGERWIDVDRETQIVTAYEGTRAVFATLASTGIGRGDDITVTPAGVHRTWVKLRSTDMTNLEDQEARRYYAMQEVPWVLFFEKGYGVHGAYWHRSFGHVRSHGCVNLTPSDARRLFEWASPALPQGWTAAFPTDYDPGTLVRVR